MEVLLLDDEDTLRVSLSDDLADAGHEVFAFPSPQQALAFLAQRPDMTAIVTDWRMPEMNGLDFLSQAKHVAPDAEVIVMTAYGNVQTAVEAIKRGAYNYLLKPFDAGELLVALDRIGEHRTIVEENRRLLARLDEQNRFHRLVGRSPAMIRLFEQLAVIGEASSDVLITGETGTGKELVAEAIHNSSPRKSRPLVKVSCAILSREILESELFGHEKGAFTGAFQTKVGRFEMANGGSIYLDDVDDIPLELQVKLLRVLQERTMERVGSSSPVQLDVRVLASSKDDLREKVQGGQVPCRPVLPPQRASGATSPAPPKDRRHSGPCAAFPSRERRSRKLEFTPEAMESLMNYPWPGNVRELKRLVERLAVTARGDRIDYPPARDPLRLPSRRLSLSW